LTESETTRLARFSREVRLSSLKRLRSVPSGFENWRPTPEAMSLAEHALHLIDCDNYLYDRLEGKNTPPVSGLSNPLEIRSRRQYDALLAALESSGNQRSHVIESLSNETLDRSIHDTRFGGEITIWWLVVRGNLDHEIHHRGQIVAYLRVAGLI